MKTRFNREIAEEVLGWFPRYLAFSKGRFGGHPFVLEPFQQTIIADLFGRQVYSEELEAWVRQIRTAYVEIPRKNGKTELGAGIALRLLFADHEKGSEIYSVAEDLDQANKVFAAARTMVEASPGLDRRAKVYKRLIEHRNGGIYRVIPGDASGNHGHNPSGVIFDELHTQGSRELWDVMTSGQGTRTQPLTVAFSTAGTDRGSICYEQHDYGEKIAAGIHADPSFYYVRYGIEEGQDWEDRDLWGRWNPALGTFLFRSFLEAEHAKARISPARQNTFRNLYANEWTQQAVRWIDLGAWDASAGMVAEPDLRSKECWGGLHIGSSTGIVAWVMAFPAEGAVSLLPRFFAPRAALAPGRPDAALLSSFERDGLLRVMEGDVIDYAMVREQIVRDAGDFDVRGMNISVVYRGSQLAQELAELFGEESVLWFRPTHPGFAFATREMERLLGARALHHGGNRFLRWQADNAVVRRNPDGDVKPDVEASQGSISGIVASLMALDLALSSTERLEPLVGWV